ncbi:hypothetical protein J5754_04460 [bacterium]|nr:hypothetical protein [bacterium]
MSRIKKELPRLCPGDGAFNRYHYDVLSWICQADGRALRLEEIHRHAELAYPALATKTTWRTAVARLGAAGYIDGTGTAPRRLTRRGFDVLYVFDKRDFPAVLPSAKRRRVYADKWEAELLAALKEHPAGLTAEELRAMPMGSKGGPAIRRLVEDGRAIWAGGRLLPHRPPMQAALF